MRTRRAEIIGGVGGGAKCRSSVHAKPALSRVNATGGPSGARDDLAGIPIGAAIMAVGRLMKGRTTPGPGGCFDSALGGLGEKARHFAHEQLWGRVHRNMLLARQNHDPAVGQQAMERRDVLCVERWTVAPQQ